MDSGSTAQVLRLSGWSKDPFPNSGRTLAKYRIYRRRWCYAWRCSQKGVEYAQLCDSDCAILWRTACWFAHNWHQKDMMHSEFVALNSRATYIRHIRNSEAMISHRSVLSFLRKSDRNALSTKIPVMTHYDYPRFFSFSNKQILLMMKAADAFIKEQRLVYPFPGK